MKTLALALLLSLACANFDFTSCSTCLANPSKKYCVGSHGSNCCSMNNMTPECDETREGITCSHEFEKENQITTTFIPPSDQKSSYYKYHICPMDNAVCGNLATLTLKVPSYRSVVTDTGVDLSSAIPPGHVCFYNINLAHNEDNNQ